jgi:geranylgeranyl pyrophosphate synthase
VHSEIVDRGGKSWRSFAFLLCIDCVGGFSPTYKHWLAMPELMHVGSLIIDDIQDKSDTRRGGPTA